RSSRKRVGTKSIRVRRLLRLRFRAKPQAKREAVGTQGGLARPRAVFILPTAPGGVDRPAGQERRTGRMPRQADKTRRLSVAYLLLAAATLGSGGCLAVVAGAAAAGGAATYFYVNGKVCQEYVATFNNTWFAAQAALKDLGYTLVANENDGKE